MGVKYLVELMPVSSQAAYRKHFPNSKCLPGPPVPPSKRIFLHRGTIPMDAISSFTDLDPYREMMTKEERELYRVMSGMDYFFDDERIEWFRDIVVQRYVRSTAEYRQEGFIFPNGLDPVATILRKVFPGIDESLFETETIFTRTWFDWYYEGDPDAWSSIEPKLRSLSRTSLVNLLQTLSSRTGFTFRRFVVGKPIKMTMWAGVWLLLFLHGHVQTMAQSRFWDSLSFHFQTMRGRKPQSAKPKSLQALGARFRDLSSLMGLSEQERQEEYNRIENLVKSLAPPEAAREASQNCVSRPLPLLEELYYLLLRKERDGLFSSQTLRKMRGYIFDTVADYNDYAKWEARIDSGEISEYHQFVRIVN